MAVPQDVSPDVRTSRSLVAVGSGGVDGTGSRSGCGASFFLVLALAPFAYRMQNHLKGGVRNDQRC